MAGFGFSALSVGGRSLWWSDQTALRSPAAPAPAFRCPTLLLAEPRAIEPFGAPPKTEARLSTSTTSPTFVLVPWASTRVAVAGSSPASFQARSTASRCPVGFGAVIPFPFPSLDAPTPRMTA